MECLMQCALYTSEPELHSTNPSGEVDYKGYVRQFAVFEGDVMLTSIQFPEALEDYPHAITHMAALDVHGKVCHVRPLTRRNLVAPGAES
jgi:hypothetical protein